MNYQKIYEQLIRFRQNNPAKKDPAVCQHFTEVEVHHIVPRSFGGSDDPSNLVELTLREHFVAHRLLYFQAKADGKSRWQRRVRKQDDMRYLVLCHGQGRKQTPEKLAKIRKGPNCIHPMSTKLPYDFRRQDIQKNQENYPDTRRLV